MEFYASFSSISAISWRSVLVAEEAGEATKCQQYKQEVLGQHTRSKQPKNVNNINKKY
jgi:hypothetical protein